MQESMKPVARALEGNERVYFHPQNGHIAVWYGASQVRLFDPETWEPVDRLTVPSEPNGAEVKLTSLGFERQGRDPDNWMLIPKEA